MLSRFGLISIFLDNFSGSSEVVIFQFDAQTTCNYFQKLLTQNKAVDSSKYNPMNLEISIKTLVLEAKKSRERRLT